MIKPGDQLAQPLDYAEEWELSRLRKCALHVPASYASEREELAALRAELERELAEVRALTEKDWPLAYAAEPVAELYWRRPLAATQRKAAEAAEAAREEKARLQREADEERRNYARQKRDHDRALLAGAHTTLTPAERAMQRSLQENWAENDLLEEPETDPIYSCLNDCGRMHLSLSAACACANIRGQEAERVTAAAMTTRPTTTTTSTRAGVSPVTPPPSQRGHRSAPPAPPRGRRRRSARRRDPRHPGNRLFPHPGNNLFPHPGNNLFRAREQGDPHPGNNLFQARRGGRPPLWRRPVGRSPRTPRRRP